MLAPFTLAVFAVLAAGFLTLAVLPAVAKSFVTAVAGLAIGCAIMFVAAGVGLVVQYQTPCASAHAWPSGALSYGSDCVTTTPCASSKVAWPLVLLILRPVSLAYSARKLLAGITSPAGST